MLKTVGLQILLVVIAALVAALFKGSAGVRDVMLGGMACVVPNLLFARLLWRLRQLQPQVYVMVFLLGEAFKLALTLLLLLAIVKWLTPAHWGLLLIGMIAAAQAPFLSMLWHRQPIGMARDTTDNDSGVQRTA